jgi:N-acetylneuraminic acid mutarotase
VVDARVFIIGGFGASDDAPEGDWEYKYDVEIYDTQTDTWSTQAGLPNAIASAASCSIGNLIYVFGGDVNATLVYDTAEGTWTERTPPSLARTDHECVRVGDSFVLIGGRDAAGNQFDAFERYEPESDTWTELEPLPAPRYWFAAGELGGSVYVVGGETFATTGDLELDSVLQFTH